jgi:hypothetical protein
MIKEGQICEEEPEVVVQIHDDAMIPSVSFMTPVDDPSMNIIMLRYDYTGGRIKERALCARHWTR